MTPPRGGRRPRRLRPRASITLPQQMLAELQAAAKVAPPGKDHCLSGQLVRLWERAAKQDLARRTAVKTQLILLDHAVAQLRAKVSLPESIELLGQIARASQETARLMERR